MSFDRDRRYQLHQEGKIFVTDMFLTYLHIMLAIRIWLLSIGLLCFSYISLSYFIFSFVLDSSSRGSK